MDILDRYLRHTRLRQWADALPLIEAMVDAEPDQATTWFDHGVCLDELGRHREAAAKFLEAYRLSPQDQGAQYRAFRSLALAGEWAPLLDLAERECRRAPALMDALLDDELLGPVLERDEFAELRKTHGR
jgi:tetratricopeptide (TPR) repeat protein